MNIRAYYIKRFCGLAFLMIMSWVVWSHQDAIGNMIDRQFEPAKARKKTFIQREAEAMNEKGIHG